MKQQPESAKEREQDKKRCKWCLGHPLYVAYHDEEWGVPVFDDRKLFEMLLLEGCQAGLSWLTILKRRENYRESYDGFDFNKIAEYNDKRCEELRQDAGIIRNRLKIKASVLNARAFIRLREEKGSFANYLWDFTDGKQIVSSVATMQDVPATTPLSDRISKDLKKRGFGFVGSTIVYAFLQAVGVTDDHLNDCWRKRGGG